MSLPSFSEVLQGAQEKPNLLLGNGFSIAAWSRFRYRSLFEVARKGGSLDPRVAAFADASGLDDFEKMVRRLNEAEEVLRHVGGSPKTMSDLCELSRATRAALLGSIVHTHPGKPGTIGDDRFEVSARFLAHFDRIFCLNYDLLLYWSCLAGKKLPGAPANDGFSRQAGGGPLIWKEQDSQRIFYLHGALHLFETSLGVEKLSWQNGAPLKNQLRDRMASGELPLIVAEGSSAEKRARIAESPFLEHSLETLEMSGGSLVVFGFGLNENDDHVFRAVKAAVSSRRLDRILISLLGDPSSADNDKLRERWTRLLSANPGLEILFFDADSAGVWPTA